MRDRFHCIGDASMTRRISCRSKFAGPVCICWLSHSAISAELLTIHDLSLSLGLEAAAKAVESCAGSGFAVAVTVLDRQGVARWSCGATGRCRRQLTPDAPGLRCGLHLGTGHGRQTDCAFTRLNGMKSLTPPFCTAAMFRPKTSKSGHKKSASKQSDLDSCGVTACRFCDCGLPQSA
jgi:hypothetical protein